MWRQAAVSYTHLLEQTKWGDFLLRNAEEAVHNAQALLCSAQKIVDEEPALLNYAAALQSDQAFFEAMSSWLQKRRWDSALLCAQDYTCLLYTSRCV